MIVAAAILVAASLATHLAVTRLGFSFSKLAPDLSRLSPAKVLKNQKRQNLTQFVQALILMPLFSMAVYTIAKDNLPAFLQLPFQTVDSGLKRVSSAIGDLLWKAAYLFMIWGSIDLFRQQKRFQADMRMSKQEIREEQKEGEGNPQMKSRIRRLQRDKKIVRAMTVDCDVHQGNGTAAIFAGTRDASDPLPSKASVMPRGTNPPGAPAGDVFTISLHQENNYPMWKPPSSIDVNLPDGTGDDDYLAWLDNALSSGLRQFEPELICYIAGADPYREDQLGGLALTVEGLKRRDELMFGVAKARDIPVMVTFAGGYARRVEDTVTIHCNTVVAAKEVFDGRITGGA
jgi:hypothetical protein